MHGLVWLNILPAARAILLWTWLAPLGNTTLLWTKELRHDCLNNLLFSKILVGGGVRLVSSVVSDGVLLQKTIPPVIILTSA